VLPFASSIDTPTEWAPGDAGKVRVAFAANFSVNTTLPCGFFIVTVAADLLGIDTVSETVPCAATVALYVNVAPCLPFGAKLYKEPGIGLVSGPMTRTCLVALDDWPRLLVTVYVTV